MTEAVRSRKARGGGEPNGARGKIGGIREAAAWRLADAIRGRSSTVAGPRGGRKEMRTGTN
jgi:hypothetical protein